MANSLAAAKGGILAAASFPPAEDCLFRAFRNHNYGQIKIPFLPPSHHCEGANQSEAPKCVQSARSSVDLLGAWCHFSFRFGKRRRRDFLGRRRPVAALIGHWLRPQKIRQRRVWQPIRRRPCFSRHRLMVQERSGPGRSSDERANTRSGTCDGTPR